MIASCPLAPRVRNHYNRGRMAKAPPVPFKRAQRRELFGEQLVDEYAWLREREDPRVRAHLEAETDYALARIDAAGAELRARLYTELRANAEFRLAFADRLRRLL